MGDFKQDLAQGQEWERWVGDYIARKRPTYDVLLAPPGHKGYDLSIVKPGYGHIYVEVKADFASGRTGNVFLETACSGKPSGLTTTTADYWCILEFTQGYARRRWHRPEALLALCELYGTFVQGGDGKRAEGYILAVEDLLT